MSNEFRTPTETERQILEFLLSADFPGVSALREQLAGLEVSRIDENGSLRLRCQHHAMASVNWRVPVEAEYFDGSTPESLEQPHVHYLLHVSEGLLWELEIYKDDGSQILQTPSISELRLFVPSENA